MADDPTLSSLDPRRKAPNDPPESCTGTVNAASAESVGLAEPAPSLRSAEPPAELRRKSARRADPSIARPKPSAAARAITRRHAGR